MVIDLQEQIRPLKATKKKARAKRNAQPRACADCGAPIYGLRVKLCKACRAKHEIARVDRRNEQLKQARGQTARGCRVCGAPVEGRNWYCDTCRETIAKAKDKIRREEANQRQRELTQKRRMQGHPCWICGDMLYGDLHTRYCSACAPIAKRNRIPMTKQAAMEELAGIKEVQQIRAARGLETSYKRKERLFSAQYTLDELARLANQYKTSYGKLRAWVDCHNRLPEAGEQIF